MLQKNFTYAVSFHSGAEVIIYPWSYTEEAPPDAEVFEEIGEDLSNIIGCPYGQSGGSLYTSSGSWDDWMYGNRSVIAFTCEIFSDDTEWFSEPGPTSDTIWQGGLRYAFNPRPNRIENAIIRWLPIFTYIADRMIAETATDINKDGVVNIKDVAKVARAYGAKYNETDGMFWHDPPCPYCPHTSDLDLNGDKEINVLDIAMVARDYGKTT